MVKVAVASLIVGTVLAHFGITADQILKDMGSRRSASPNSRARASPGRCRTAARLVDHRAGVVRGVPVPPARTKSE